MQPAIPGDSLLELARQRTSARILTGSAGESYRTHTHLALRADHAAARDAVHAEIDLQRDLAELVQQHELFELRTRVENKVQYLLRPDLGRQLSDQARDHLRQHGTHGAELQIFLGDGLSAAAVAVQTPTLLPRLLARAREGGWSLGRPFLVRYSRVGVLNDVGDLLGPQVTVLLIGERPGLATAESLSAYMAYRPRSGDTDAKRNLISNIHGRGVGIEEAVERILALATTMRYRQASGVTVKEELAMIPEDGRKQERSGLTSGKPET